MWVFDDIGCLFEAAPPVDPFDSGEVSVYCSLQPPSFLGIRVTEPDHDATSQYTLTTHQ